MADLEKGEPSVRLEILGQPSISNSGEYGSFFEPQRDTNFQSRRNYSHNNNQIDEAPEKKLTLFALRLAILEKAASGIGTLGFIWATVVLLGGFAIALEKKDFWYITIILLIEGTRIFSRGHELKWQHQTTWSLSSRSSLLRIRSYPRRFLMSLKFIFRPLPTESRKNATSIQVIGHESVSEETPPRTWNTSEVPLLSGWVFLSRNVSRVLYWLQLMAASACISLALMRLVQQDFGVLPPDDHDKKNRKAALNIFYSLALAEALLFLGERAYWEWKVSYQLLLDEVNKDCDLGPSGMVSIRRFFYDAYSNCIEGSIFDGLKMDLVTFAEELLVSSSRDEQLIGARILHKFSTNLRFADSTLRKLGTSTSVMERLVEMLNWKNPAEVEIRRSAAVIVSMLAGKKQNALRVAGIPGAMESISSLLYTGHNVSFIKSDELHQQYMQEISEFNLLGLLILKKLTNDHDNCGKIGNTRGLLSKIIEFTSGGKQLEKSECVVESQVNVLKRSLQVVKKLTSASGMTGGLLRREISMNVFIISNIREILQYGAKHVMIQKLGVEILTSLAMDEEAREKIGSIGGMLKELLKIFFTGGLTVQQDGVRKEAGESLAMLTLENKNNCARILKDINGLKRLVESLNDSVVQVHSSRILRNLCKYSGHEYLLQLREVTAGFGMVLNAIMVEDMKLLEVSLGLAAQIVRFMSAEQCFQELENVGLQCTSLAERLVQILKQHNYPSIKVPRIRLFVVELTIWLMGSDAKCIELFNSLGMKKELENVSLTTSELECFSVFSGSEGLSRHNLPLFSLAEIALELITRS